MKFPPVGTANGRPRPAPQGAGGLKFAATFKCAYENESRPARGGWIEIGVPQWTRLHSRSRPARGGWIEIS